MTRPTIKLLITQDLGYCCEYFFFSCFRQTAVIADRLGVTPRAVKYHKAAVRDGKSTCCGGPNCKMGSKRKPPAGG